MTRSYRAIQLPSVCFVFAFFALSPLAASPAQAGIIDFLTSAFHGSDAAQPVTEHVAIAPAAPDMDFDTGTDDADLGEFPAPVPKPVPTATAANAAPIVEWTAKHLYCVEYARIRSGLKIFGDAKYWWNKAADMYARASQPVADAVMVFAGSKRIRHGHVAVVTAVLGPREIKVDHANWQNHGEIDLNMPVMDVSKNNDWSKVRVWNPKSGQYGAHVYAISGFIERNPPVTRGS